MLTRYALILLLSLAAFGQTTSPPLVDFSLVGITKPVTMGSTPPETCEDGQLFFVTSAPAGSNLFSCLGGQWTVLGNGVPASVLVAATSTTLGVVMVPDNSGLGLNGGAISVLYGTGPNTAMQGDDARVTGLATVARTGTWTDLLNKPTNLLTTTGNAASATKLLATPLACLAGRYVISITATGNANCAQVLYSQLGGIPAAYALPQATTTLLGGIKAGTGLSSTLGVLAVKYGTVAGTAAQGNDSRILGALQKATGLAALGLTGLTPVTINSPTTGKAGSAGVADIARKLQGTGPLQMKGLCGTAPLATTGLIDLYLDTDCNLHLKDAANLNRSVMVWTWKNGVEQKCDQSLGYSAITDFSASGGPICTVAPAPPAPPAGVTVSGSSCTITKITNGVIVEASCTN